MTHEIENEKCWNGKLFFVMNNLRDRSFVSGLGLTFISAVMTGVAVGAGGSGAKSMYVSGTLITTFPF